MRNRMYYLLASVIVCVFSFVARGSEELEDTPAAAYAPLGPVMEVYGNGYLIENGSAYPAKHNLTDFEFEYIGERHTHWFSIKNAGDEDLILSGPVYVSIVGIDDEHFYVKAQPSITTIPAGTYVSFAIAFEPETYGEKEVTVQIHSNDTANSPYAFLVKGGDEDDDRDRLYWGCAMAGTGDLGWLLPLSVLAILLLIRRLNSSSAY